VVGDQAVDQLGGLGGPGEAGGGDQRRRSRNRPSRSSITISYRR
jgi:hypothetical protein